ncbi:hypothetical protein ACFQ88_08550, partial [Paenibacillus sp. NPDC056579]|uniref:hypothetical protein n=1 Tax=Paenibacillus sp. NPDC056579 TaxID=3345871 RepID=UPI0036B8D76B
DFPRYSGGSGTMLLLRDSVTRFFLLTAGLEALDRHCKADFPRYSLARQQPQRNEMIRLLQALANFVRVAIPPPNKTKSRARSHPLERLCFDIT